MHLRRLHLQNLTPYVHASSLQSNLVRLHLHAKAAPLTAPTRPPPTLLTFQTPPTYTCGRREINALSAAQIAHLRAGGTAEFHEAQRGGQTTFHGPGQLTAYLILDLKAHRLSPRCYVHMLEDAVIGTCLRYGVGSHRTGNPGVWVGPGTAEDRKVASVGVHLRRGVASHGVGINVRVGLGWFDRIVMCGLEGKRATNIEGEVGPGGGVKGHIPMEDMAGVFAGEVAARLEGVEGKVQIADEQSLLTW